eukprot:TRINITY_DN9430_c0_g1_i1.p1 TRINITY_DN9430_c0_g1~~TRINITY_DN9430_c0_g1_i1.p1  ORF type:complete len:718 (-),score=159.54 TRINITY_DN9430_c0_g1_i1:80-2233(-)
MIGCAFCTARIETVQNVLALYGTPLNTQVDMEMLDIRQDLISYTSTHKLNAVNDLKCLQDLHAARKQSKAMPVVTATEFTRTASPRQDATPTSNIMKPMEQTVAENEIMRSLITKLETELAEARSEIESLKQSGIAANIKATEAVYAATQQRAARLRIGIENAKLKSQLTGAPCHTDEASTIPEIGELDQLLQANHAELAVKQQQLDCTEQQLSECLHRQAQTEAAVAGLEITIAQQKAEYDKLEQYCKDLQHTNKQLIRGVESFKQQMATQRLDHDSVQKQRDKLASILQAMQVDPTVALQNRKSAGSTPPKRASVSSLSSSRRSSGGRLSVTFADEVMPFQTEEQDVATSFTVVPVDKLVECRVWEVDGDEKALVGTGHVELVRNCDQIARRRHYVCMTVAEQPQPLYIALHNRVQLSPMKQGTTEDDFQPLKSISTTGVVMDSVAPAYHLFDPQSASSYIIQFTGDDTSRNAFVRNFYCALSLAAVREIAFVKSTRDPTILLPQERMVMLSGVVFTKFNFHNKGSSKRTMRYNPESSCIEWTKGSEAPRVTPLSEIRWIMYGAKTKRFRTTPPKYPWCCLSIVTTKRTIDLVADYQEQAEAWFLGLQALLHWSILLNGRVLETYGRVLWKRLRARVTARSKLPWPEEVKESVRRASLVLPSYRRASQVGLEVEGDGAVEPVAVTTMMAGEDEGCDDLESPAVIPLQPAAPVSVE